MTKRNILVIRLGAMGDIIHALPAVAGLKASFPDSHLTWVVDEKWRPLLQDNPYVDEVALVNRKSLRSLLELRRRLRKQRFDVAVDFQGLIKSALVASASRAERIIGFDRTQAREALAAMVYSHPVKTRSAHVVDQNVEVAVAAGGSTILKVFPLPQGTAEGGLPDGEFVLASPNAGWTSKQWPAENYTALARLLRDQFDVPLVLNFAPGSTPIPGARMHISGIEGLIDATRRATAVVGVDSGPMHIAAALGKPGVAIFGPTDPARNGPYGESMRVLRSPKAVTNYKRRPEIDTSMRDVTVDAVFEALRTCMHYTVQ